MNIGTEEFFDLERRLIESGMDADLDSFEVIRERLRTKAPLDPDEFARNAIYVVLAGGFSQKTAKRAHGKIMLSLQGKQAVKPSAGAACGAGVPCDDSVVFDELFEIFRNKNKIRAIIKLWRNRARYCADYYALPDKLDVRLTWLAGLPHIGKITACHLARNLGENVFKRDVWIERLLAAQGRDLLERLEHETGLPRGYVDVVLWKACQNGMIKIA